MSKASPRSLRSVVSGATGQLGTEICRVLVARGDRVVGLDIADTSEATDLHLKVDLTDRASVELGIDRAVGFLDGIDVFVHAAGVIATKPFLDLSDVEFQRHVDVNLLGTFRVCQSVARVMKPTGGRIVLITSIHGQIGVAQRAAYAATKGAIAAMGRVMAAELAADSIRVNMLSPGAIDGGMSPEPGARQKWIDATPSRRVAKLQEVAQAAAMLTSDDASFVNGQTIAIDGGASTLRTL